jgi:putative membrane protein
MLEIIFFALIGALIGIVTGLIPGLHVNTVAVVGLGIFAGLGLTPLQFVIILTALSVTHAFLDFLPSIFIGAPQEETALSVLPAHRLFMNGRAVEAVKLTALGCLMGITAGLLFLIPAFYIIPILYNATRPYIAYVLILAVIALIATERSRRNMLWASVIFIASGILGLIILERQKMLSTTEILFPVFVGLFGLSNLIDSLKSRSVAVPQEEYIKVEPEPKYIGSGILGAVSGAIIGILPAISPSQLGGLISGITKLDTKSFLVFVAAINTSDAIYSLLALYTIQNPRSGVAVIAGKVLDMDLNIVILLVGVIAFTAFFATYVHIEIGKRMTKIVARINYKKLCIASIATILALVFFFTGFFGLSLAILCTIIGLLPIMSGVSRTHLMGVLLIPTITYFLF